MKSTNRIYAFFVILSLLFWNPLSYYLIYGNTPAFDFKVISIFYWFAIFAGAVVTYLMLKNKLNNKLKNTFLTLSFTGILFAFFVLTDGVLGFTLSNSSSKINTIIGKNKGLIFSPNSKATYQTVEFDFIASINSIGLRDIEINIDKQKKYRILCFGDSFTYGWGVNGEDAWPKKLETYFHELGYTEIEIVNCGEPGQYTNDYKENISKVVPVLKPDLVIAGILQGDDLSQLYSNRDRILTDSTSKANKNNVKRRTKLAGKTYLKVSFENILALIRKNKTVSNTIDIRSNWKTSSNKMVQEFDHAQNHRYQLLQDTVKQLFASGNLNPGLLSSYINDPYSLTIFNDPTHFATRFASRMMEKDVKEMKAVCKDNNCNFIFANIAINQFTGHKVERTSLDIVNPLLEKNNKIDSIYSSIAASSGVPYIELTDHFRSLSPKDAYFFLYDGHPNEKGYEEIANYIGEQLINQNLIQINK